MNRIKQFAQSLSCATRGLSHIIKNEKNFQNELAAAALVVFVMFYFDVTRTEMTALVLVIAGVLIMELLNTIVERVVDILKPKVHPYARLIKDLMAATVLISVIFAIVIGLIIFLPYIFACWQI
ncbi:MAG TPA: diacylglycerol kinase [Candidatus Moranbacteria bacterium]|nr:diacylglycerol kinase [Candidatus Moranbacteria bacterium]HAT74653.1 diacylglycerol kinase [Candidatus Moranbacteria bacterium]